MHLSDIIKTDSDRLFIVDTECFIIFTGGSITDDRPFIRIGTWYDLPVEIIPLVENIIVSDRILGNPSYEQFNIDVRHLETNRYIGGESILKRFLEYQRIFGLDLTNVSLVNIEKDIPELSSQKNVSDRDQFIGIFYSDGNIKINHGNKNIFDLNAINRENIDNAGILDRISANSKNTDRYRGSGIIIIDNNPVFYRKGNFSSYQFPDKCLHDFSILQIDPSYIRELLLPSQNLINISGFMKFKNSRGGKIKLFSDNTEQVDLIKKLFKNATVSDDKFSNLHMNVTEGLKISSYPNSPNIRISFRREDENTEDISLPFIKSPSDTAKILKEKSDAVVITYTAYEESALLFKSTETAVIIVDDGNPNIKKISESDKIILKPGIQYDLKKYRSFDDLLKSYTGLDQIKTAIENSDNGRITGLIDSLIESGGQSVELLNVPGLLKAYMSNTSDRKKYSMLKDIYQNYSRKIVLIPTAEMRASRKTVLSFYNNLCCPVLMEVATPAAEIFIDEYSESNINGFTLNNEQKTLGDRIVEDRKRLNSLLSMFYKELTGSPSFGNIEKEMSLLKNEISTRKDIYNSEFYSVGNSATKKTESKKKDKRPVHSEKSGTGKEPAATDLIKRLTGNKKLLIPSVFLVMIILAAGAFYMIKFKKPTAGNFISESDIKPVENKNIVITVKRVNEEEKQLLLKHNVKISEADIYRYSNEVAVKNGYKEISYNGFKEKNPHWIYPSNVFIMHDGEKVVVQSGDTLWDLAHAKLEKMNADFYNIMERMEKTDPSDRSKVESLIREAEKYSYIKQQIQILDSYKKRMKDER